MSETQWVKLNEWDPMSEIQMNLLVKLATETTMLMNCLQKRPLNQTIKETGRRPYNHLQSKHHNVPVILPALCSLRRQKNCLNCSNYPKWLAQHLKKLLRWTTITSKVYQKNPILSAPWLWWSTKNPSGCEVEAALEAVTGWSWALALPPDAKTAQLTGYSLGHRTASRLPARNTKLFGLRILYDVPGDGIPRTYQ